MNITFEVDSKQYKDLLSYCELNKFVVEDIVKKSYLEGFMIEKYGLLGANTGVKEKETIKEVIVEKRIEIPIETIKEIVKIEYVEVPVEKIVEIEKPVDRLVEVVKEVPIERVVEKVIEVVREVPVEKIVEVVKEVPVEKIVEVVKEVPVEKIVEVVVTKKEYVSDDSKTNELLSKIQQLEIDKQLSSTKIEELERETLKFSTKTIEMENIFQDKMSKKEDELDELRRSLDEALDKPPVEKIVEKIVEVVVEKEITDNLSKSKLEALQNTLTKIRGETLEKDKRIIELERTIQEIQKFQENKQAVYLKGSNLGDKLYK